MTAPAWQAAAVANMAPILSKNGSEDSSVADGPRGPQRHPLLFAVVSYRRPIGGLVGFDALVGYCAVVSDGIHVSVVPYIETETPDAQPPNQ